MPSTVIIRVVAATLAVGGLWVGWTQQAPQPLEIVRVKDALHVIYGSGGNVGVLPTGEGVVLIDDKFDRNVAEILEKVKSITSEPVRYVFNTHHHGDHAGGNETLVKTATIVAHENARANMLRGSQAGAAPLTFSEQQTLHLGGHEIRALYYGRAHTNGDVVLHFRNLRTVHTGDMFVRGAPYIDYANGGSAVEWDDTLNEVLQLEFDTVIPGHGPVATREDLTQWKTDFDTFRGLVTDLVEDGKKPEEAAALLDVSDLEGWSIGALQMRAMPGLFQELR